MIRVVLAEDNNFLAQSLQERIGLFEGIKLKYRARDGKDLLEKIAKDSLVDIILMDIEMPEMDGIEATERIKKDHPQIRIIMLTVFDDDQKIFDSILAGADGYLLKDETPAKLEEGIRMILEGGAPMSATIAAKVLRLMRIPADKRSPAEVPEFNLSERETQILEQICKGLNYNQISGNLVISPATVRKHIENVYRKLQVHNKAEAIQTAMRHRLV